MGCDNYNGSCDIKSAREKSPSWHLSCTSLIHGDTRPRSQARQDFTPETGSHDPQIPLQSAAVPVFRAPLVRFSPGGGWGGALLHPLPAHGAAGAAAASGKDRLGAPAAGCAALFTPLLRTPAPNRKRLRSLHRAGAGELPEG